MTTPRNAFAKRNGKSKSRAKTLIDEETQIKWKSTTIETDEEIYKRFLTVKINDNLKLKEMLRQAMLMYLEVHEYKTLQNK